MIHITVNSVGKHSVFILDYICGVYPSAKPDTIIQAQMRSDIYLNGEIAGEDVFVTDGDEIGLNLFFFHLGLPPVLDILYEDEHFIAIEKMPGVLSFDEYKTGDVNVYDMALEYMLQKGEYSVESLTVPYLCYTLPEFAGGVLLIAKHEEAYHYMAAALQQRKVHTDYEAAVVGRPQMEVDELMHYMDSACHVYPLRREGAYPIVTRYQCKEYLAKHTIVDIKPVTCRRFQVYAHMAYIGHPILGDELFGKMRANRQAMIDYEAVWLKSLHFSIGPREPFAYLNHVHLTVEDVAYPTIIYKKGKKIDSHEDA